MLPYIGITGFVSGLDAELALSHFKRLGLSPKRKFMVGVLVSHRSRHGQPLKPKWAKKYPDPAIINDIFCPDPAALNLIHYNSREPHLCDQLEDLLGLAPNCDGFQLNIAWPDPEELARFREEHPDKVIVLQVGSGAFDQIGKSLAGGFNFDQLSHITSASIRIRAYLGLVDYFLPDLSGGIGKEMDQDFMAAIIGDMLRFERSPLPVVGGGLEATNIGEIIGLLRLCPQLSWDTEGRLFDGDRLSMDKCLAYLQASAALVQLVG